MCIFGIDSYHSDYFKVFFEKLKKDSELRLYYHPSRRYPISIKEQDEIEAYVEKLIEEKKLTNDQMKKFRNKVFKVYGERLYKFYNKNQIKVSSIMKKLMYQNLCKHSIKFNVAINLETKTEGITLCFCFPL